GPALYLCEFPFNADRAGEVQSDRTFHVGVDGAAAGQWSTAGGPVAQSFIGCCATNGGLVDWLGAESRARSITAFDRRTKRVISSLSVFFPAYNDEVSLPGLVDKAFAVLRENTTDYELIVVNDGSSDGTAAV